jgi:CRISPR-associated protein Csb1
MPIDYATLEKSSRLLMEVALRPLQGDRFQPTGFPDLGAGRYALPDGTEMLLVESAQSVANRLELACWDEANDDLIPELKGLPYVRIDCGDLGKTNTLKEFHRLNSPYIWEGRETEASKKFREAFMNDLGLKPTQKRKKKGDEEVEEADVPGVLDFRKFYRAIFRWDPNSVIHGVFLEKVAGRLRMTRALSGFIEATGVRPAENGGAKFDHILPSPKVIGLDAKTGYGNVPFHRTEFVGKIKVYFNLDLALLRGYGLGDDATRLLIALALFKIRRFLSTGLRLRTACDLKPEGEMNVTQPTGFTVPPETDLLTECKRLIDSCAKAKLFAEVMPVKWEAAATAKATVDLPSDSSDPSIPEDLKRLVKFKKGTSKKAPQLTFLRGLTADLAEKTKALFAMAPEVCKAIDDALKQVTEPFEGEKQHSDQDKEGQE